MGAWRDFRIPERAPDGAWPGFVRTGHMVDVRVVPTEGHLVRWPGFGATGSHCDPERESGLTTRAAAKGFSEIPG